MKTLRLILIISIIGYCFTQTEEVDCGSIFEGLVKEKCEAMGHAPIIVLVEPVWKLMLVRMETKNLNQFAKELFPQILIDLNVSKMEQIATKLLKNVLIGI